MFHFVELFADLNITILCTFCEHRTRKTLDYLVHEIFLGDVVDLNNFPSSPFPRRSLGTSIHYDVSVNIPRSLQLCKSLQLRRNDCIGAEMVTGDNWLNDLRENGDGHLLTIHGGKNGE